MMKKVALIMRGEPTPRQRAMLQALFGNAEAEKIEQLPTNPKEASETLKGYTDVVLMMENPNLVSVLQTVRRFNPEMNYYMLRNKRIGAYETEEEAKKVAQETGADIVFHNPRAGKWFVSKSEELLVNPEVEIKADEEITEPEEIDKSLPAKKVVVIGPSEPTERQKQLLETFLKAPVEFTERITTAPDNPKELSELVKGKDAVLSLVLVAPVVNNLATVKRFTGIPYAVAKTKAIATEILNNEEEIERKREELGADVVLTKELPEGISARFLRTEALLANPEVEIKAEQTVNIDKLLEQMKNQTNNPSR